MRLAYVRRKLWNVAPAGIGGRPASASFAFARSIGPPGTFQGTWRSSGALGDAGTFVETELHPTGSLADSPVVGAFQAIIVFSGSQGTFTIGQEALFTTDNLGGNWQFVSGTGAYQRLRGHGIFEFVFPNSLTFTGIAFMVT